MRARTLLGTSTVAALALTGIVASPAMAAEHPVINEFSADTTSTDVEYIEVLAAPGTRFDPDLVLDALGRLARAVGAHAERYAALLRIGG